MCVVQDIFRFQMSPLLIYSIVETLFCVFSLFACCTAIVPCSTAAVNKKHTKNSILYPEIQQMAMNGPLEFYQRVETNVYLTPLISDRTPAYCLQ